MFYDAEPFCAKRFYSELVKCFQFRFDLISITDVGKTVVLMFLMVCLMFSCYVLTKTVNVHVCVYTNKMS